MSDQNKFFDWANTEEFVTVQGKSTGREYRLRQFTYGVLVPDDAHPLSAVSVANSSLSIDLWAGCPWQCRYCHVQDTIKDLADHGRMPVKPIRRNDFTIDQILDALVDHPFFVPDQTVISIGTASTEPFGTEEVTASTFGIMRAFVRRGLKNPFWIITKASVPKDRKQDFVYVINASRGLMISLCWADNPKTIEPTSNNRFLHCEEAKDAGACISWYMRPIVAEWNGNQQHIEMMMLWVKEHYGDVIDMIVPGGLRWTQGIENGLVEIHGLPMPDIPKDDNVKEMPQELWEFILKCCCRLFPGKPVFRRSNCALAKMLGLASLNSIQTRARNFCENSVCPASQRAICANSAVFNWSVESAQELLDGLRVPAQVVEYSWKKGLITSPPLETFTYAVRQTVLKHLSMGDINHASDK